MSDKILDLKKNVHDLVEEFPEVSDIMVELGFKDISNPVALNTMGRVMTIPKGSQIKGIELSEIVDVFENKGFKVINLPGSNKPESKPENSSAREILLRSYVERLTRGEDLATVKAEFVENFSEVDALEIANAEQHLIKSGVPFHEVQKLCDVHSALFHGATKQEQLANAEKAVAASRESVNKRMNGVNDRKAAEVKLQTLTDIPGHPLNVLSLENDAISREIKIINGLFESNASREEITVELNKLRRVSIHYAKKGDVIYTILKTRYDVTGPSDVMWTVDDEIRDELRNVSDGKIEDDEWLKRTKAVVKRADEMLYKEANILFPICVQFFKDEEWREIARDLKDYDLCLLDEAPAEWEEAFGGDYKHKAAKNGRSNGEDELVFAGGHMTPHQIEAVFNTIPMELTFVDHIDMNRFYNNNDEKKLFKRPISSLDREVYTCHPPTIEPMVRSIISSFKSGAQDKVEVWMNKGGSDVLVSYRAVRDSEGEYVGTLECVQVMDEIKKHFLNSEN